MQMGPYLEMVMAELVPALPSLIDQPVTKKRDVGATDDQLYAFEAAGLLVGCEDLSTAEVQHHYLAALLQPLRIKIEDALKR